MKSCNCTLAGTAACSSCSSNNLIWTAPDWSVFNTEDFKYPEWLTNYFDINVYDPEKYDLVEKKDYKIKKLKEDIETTKKFIGDTNASYNYYADKITEYLTKKDKLTKELKQLEQELQELESKKKE
jgi:hypothetical protein